MPIETHRIVEYPASMAGERVGWVATGALPGDPENLLAVDVVTATVGNNGAWHGYHYAASSERDGGYHGLAQEGFCAVAAITAVLVRDQRGDFIEEQSLGLQFPRKTRDIDSDKKALLSQGIGRRPVDLPGYKRAEASSRKELIDTIKGQLQDAGFEDQYPKIYYWLNGSPQLSGRDVEGVTLPEMLVPDPSMRTQTADQAIAAESIASILTNLRDRNDVMRGRLTVFSDVPGTEIPGRFIDNREFAHSAEQIVLGKLGDLAVKRLVYLPVGAARTWPYMDASAKGQSGYGPELAGLRQRSIHPAYEALADESRELERRARFAQSAVERFRLMLALEKNK